MERKWWVFKNSEKEKRELADEIHTREIIGSTQKGDIRKEKFGGIALDQHESEFTIVDNLEAKEVLGKLKPTLQIWESDIKRKEDEIAEMTNKLDRMREYKLYLKKSYEINSEIAELNNELARENDPIKKRKIEEQLAIKERVFDATIIETRLRQKSKELKDIENGALESEEAALRAKLDRESEHLDELKKRVTN